MCFLSQITRSSFGEVMTVPLIPGGSSVAVTLDNRTEYVRAYMRHVLDESVKDPFMAFDEGFRRVCDGKVLVSGMVMACNMHTCIHCTCAFMFPALHVHMYMYMYIPVHV